MWLSDNVCPANFNSRPSARGDRLIARCAARRTHFNSRPSARGDRAAERRRLHPRISIHAPPRGATITRREAIQLCRISIHAPPRGATRVVFLSFVAFHFNSRPSARGDISFLDGVVNYDISIHAPPRGATRRHAPPLHPLPISIHAPPRGATTNRSLTRRFSVFQFTPLREGRHV